MNTRRLMILGLILLLLISGSYGWRLFVQQDRFAPQAETASIALDRSVGGSSKTTDELIAFWQTRVKNAPHDYISMTYLGQAYLNKARESADVSNYAKAEEALINALDANPGYASATAFLGAVRFSQHEFSEALTLAEAVYEDDPKAIMALALMGDANLELGNYGEATTLYEQLFAQNQSPPVLSRMARLAWLNGDVETAVSTMQQAADDALEAGLTGESLAWYQFQLGELYFQSGDLDNAYTQYDLSLQSFPNYYLGLAGTGKVLAAQGKLSEAIARYEQVVNASPDPTFVAYLGDLYTAVGNSQKAADQYELVDFIAQLEESQGILYNRQLSLYYANHTVNVAEALTIAEAELEARQDIYAYDTLAWALYANGRYEEAATAIDQALQLGTQDAMIFYHAGMIYNALNQTEQAKIYLENSLAVNPYFDLQHAAQAEKTLSQLQVASR